MELVFEFGVILAVTFAAELLRAILPFAVPSSIYGLLLMLLCLKTGVIKLQNVKRGGAFLLEIMPLMFVPAAVGLMTVVGGLRSALIPIVLITAATTVLVMAATGKTAQAVIRRDRRK